MNDNKEQEILGIVGGLGPLASAEFLKTIYENSLGAREQDSPRVILFSDPTFPDRTESFLRDEQEVLLAKLENSLVRLVELGASKIVICCITLHHVLPQVSPELRESVISLMDVIFENVLRMRKPLLLTCTCGTRKMRIFQEHPKWETCKNFIVLPDEEDQDRIHDLIYRGVKANADIPGLTPAFESILEKYPVEGFIAGCTEIHLLAKHISQSKNVRRPYVILDPLTAIAHDIAKPHMRVLPKSG